ncbi:MAG: dTMP kinase [Bacilli bacterium]|jgi:dTMP kinase|nr:dTMP kinase [Bacilli bacterium]MDD3389415.1 dTMP kinase [Bacilli bacterium]MDD4344832.1 dTMP kinase [Bacilli bacterium]MDD4520782.1 dTMP kinase [Bacilli bacterium]MDY0399444.1 dTMP kinase [Bacilli bacterium]
MFISFEGPEGSGKTSVIKAICQFFDENKIDYLHTREPGGTPIAEKIRNVVLDKQNTNLDARAEALLIAASRRQHLVEKIWPALAKGQIVLCDRFLDSSLAYQGSARDIGVDAVLKMNEFATEGCWPDLTILFDLRPEVGLERIAANAAREVNRLDLEKLSFHTKVRETYLQLAENYPLRYVIINAELPLQDVIEATKKVILTAIENKK